MGMIKEIIIWVAVLVIAGLILNFLINADYSSIKNTIKNIKLPQIKTNNTINNNAIKEEYIRLVPSEDGNALMPKYCSQISAYGDAKAENFLKRNICSAQCEKNKLYFYSYKCENDLFVCYCKK